ncbi:MAG: hypothetical protein IJ232_06045, partial [Lachnospiraceae bacterium]|nr:hypothetical protein [Lachnospiraceae bacterium]
MITLAMVLSVFAYLPIKNAKAATSEGLVFSGTVNVADTINATVTYANGTVTISGTNLSLNNTTEVCTEDQAPMTLTFTPNTGYKIGEIRIAGALISLSADNKYTWTPEANAHSGIDVSFEEDVAYTYLDFNTGTATVDTTNNKVTYTVDGTAVEISISDAAGGSYTWDGQVMKIKLDKLNQITFAIADYSSVQESISVKVDKAGTMTSVNSISGDGKFNLGGMLEEASNAGNGYRLRVEPAGNQNPGPAPANDDYEDINIEATFNGCKGEILINGTRITPDTGEVESFTGTVPQIGYTSEDETNEIIIRTEFAYVVNRIVINGVEYTFDDDSDEQTIEVAGATSYNISVFGTADDRKTIIWANPGATDIDSADALIEHGNARIIAVYDENGNKLDYHEYTNQEEQPDGSRSDAYGLRNNSGWAVVKAGYKVVFEFTPEYGYQLTKVAANEQELEPQSTTNQYVFTMPNTHVHFAATFTKTEDVVKTDSSSVESGTIELGGALDGGSAQLTVNDVELSSDKIAGFESAAGDYTISNYLDIDLYNVFYKGKNDANDVWSNKISELDKEATITIQLAEGVTADDIVIVHNVHDGDEYEVIEIESYDAATNTITFKTKSFSNYAIATKVKGVTTVTTPDKTTTTPTTATTSPKTGDNMMLFVILLSMSVLGFGILTISGIKKKLSK